jgi:hypothetical protein
MVRRARSVLLLLLPLCRAFIMVPMSLQMDSPLGRNRGPSIYLKENRPPLPKIRDNGENEGSLYTTPNFEFDAVTVTALLGAAIAFQFFVLANL